METLLFAINLLSTPNWTCLVYFAVSSSLCKLYFVVLLSSHNPVFFYTMHFFKWTLCPLTSKNLPRQPLALSTKSNSHDLLSWLINLVNYWVNIQFLQVYSIVGDLLFHVFLPELVAISLIPMFKNSTLYLLLTHVSATSPDYLEQRFPNLKAHRNHHWKAC